MSQPAYTGPSAAAHGSTEPGPAVTCSACGCRLDHAADLNAYIHYSPAAGRDAHGCRVACADKLHDARGRSL